MVPICLTSCFLFSIFVIAVSSTYNGNMRLFRLLISLLRRHLGLILLVVLLGLLVVLAFDNAFKDWADTLAVWSMLCLAFIAFWTILRNFEERSKEKQGELLRDASRSIRELWTFLAQEKVPKTNNDMHSYFMRLGLHVTNFPDFAEFVAKYGDEETRSLADKLDSELIALAVALAAGRGDLPITPEVQKQVLDSLQSARDNAFKLNRGLTKVKFI